MLYSREQAAIVKEMIKTRIFEGTETLIAETLKLLRQTLLLLLRNRVVRNYSWYGGVLFVI